MRHFLILVLLLVSTISFASKDNLDDLKKKILENPNHFFRNRSGFAKIAVSDKDKTPIISIIKKDDTFFDRSQKKAAELVDTIYSTVFEDDYRKKYEKHTGTFKFQDTDGISHEFDCDIFHMYNCGFFIFRSCKRSKAGFSITKSNKKKMIYEEQKYEACYKKDKKINQTLKKKEVDSVKSINNDIEEGQKGSIK